MATSYTYTGGTGAFDVFGSGAARIKTNRTHSTDLETQRGTLISKFPSADAYRVLPALAAIEASIAQDSATNQAIGAAMALHLVDTVDAEDAIPAQTVPEAAKRLVEFMIEDSKTFTDSTVSGTPAYAAANTGSGKMVVGVKNYLGDDLTQMRAEDIVFECLTDAQGPGSLVAGAEFFSFFSEKGLPRDHRDWPAGSGMAGTISSTHGAREQSTSPGLNRLKNGGFERWASGAPDGWTEDVQGARITEETSVTFRGSSSVLITGDGSTLAKLSQNLDGTDGMRLEPRKPYVLSIWARSDGTVAAGALKVSIQDGASGILTDDGSNALEVAIDATALTTSYVNYSAVVWAPSDIHASAEIVIEETTAVSNTEVIYLGGAVLAEAVQPHKAGPQFAIVAGATDWVVGDKLTLTVANDWAADTWNMESDRLFGTYELGLFPPHAGAGNISDGLIT